MQVQVTGKHVDVGEALRTRVTSELTSSIGKFFDRGGDADVVVSRDGHSFRVDCAVQLASGQLLRSHGLGGDAHLAFDNALEKVQKRIRRYKQRLRSHAVAAGAKAAETASHFVIRANDEAQDEHWEEEDHSPPARMIIAETDAQIKTLTVSGAVMELDLTDSQTIVFRNAAHDGLSVVYRRPDGNIGWIDPARTRSRNGNGKGG
ncbi:MAG: ribosome-associated translation inhibitor RaiA [Alphaproteobacteria bacterium]